MKALRFFAVISFVIVIGMIICVGILNVEASDYLGEFCWSAKGGEALLKLGVSNIGGQHYILSGKLVDKGVLKGPVHGNAEIEGESIYTTLVGTDKDADEISTQIFHVILDINTLNGTIEGIQHQYNYHEIPAFETEYNEPGTLTFISCP